MASIQDRITILKQYLLAKFDESDWHGCSDAANDIRVLECELKCQMQLHASSMCPPLGGSITIIKMRDDSEDRFCPTKSVEIDPKVD